MKFSIMKFPEALKWLMKQYAIHEDGTDGVSHTLATELNAGFASPELVRLANGHYIKDNDLGLKYPDMFDIPFGSYSTIWQWKNQNPPGIGDNYNMNIVVVGEHRLRKNIFVFGGTGGRVYYINNYNTRSAGGTGTPTLWRIMTGETDLWSGTGNTNGQELDLLDTLNNYSEFKIYYRSQGEQVATSYTTAISINGAYTSTDESPNAGIIKIRISPVDTGNTKLKIDLLKRVTIKNDGSGNEALTSTASGIVITRIKGVR